jgi:protein TonB
MFGVLDADQRIRRSAERHERALWAGAFLATLIYTSLIAGQAMSLIVMPNPLEQRQKERRGQGGESISVELVPEPDFKAKTAHWQDGANAPTPAPPSEMMMPQPPQTAMREPEEKPEPVEKPEEKPEEKQAEKPEEKPSDKPRDADSPMLLDIESLVDAAAADLTRKIDDAFAEKEARDRRKRQAAVSGGGLKVRGVGASGRSDAFTKSVVAALMKTRPGPFALLGRVLVSFQISEGGELRYVKLLESSGNSALDEAALNAIRKARFARPPPGLSPDDRTYIIDYIFG